jgi:hypothetical protein
VAGIASELAIGGFKFAFHLFGFGISFAVHGGKGDGDEAVISGNSHGGQSHSRQGHSWQGHQQSEAHGSQRQEGDKTINQTWAHELEFEFANHKLASQSWLSYLMEPKKPV